jgi:hypothetical protein
MAADANLLGVKTLHVVGARPNFMKVAASIEALRSHALAGPARTPDSEAAL